MKAHSRPPPADPAPDATLAEQQQFEQMFRDTMVLPDRSKKRPSPVPKTLTEEQEKIRRWLWKTFADAWERARREQRRQDRLALAKSSPPGRESIGGWPKAESTS